jgi:hypothetical protein
MGLSPCGLLFVLAEGGANSSAARLQPIVYKGAVDCMTTRDNERRMTFQDDSYCERLVRGLAESVHDKWALFIDIRWKQTNKTRGNHGHLHLL